ncbi:MAG TPA: sialidase family protein, partial [Gaiellaceae bacterium]
MVVLTVFAAAVFAVGSANAFTISTPVNVTQDQLSQNETPLAVNPGNPQMLLSGSNDWNYNDGCGMYVSMNGGQSWTGALPEGYLPGITKYTNDPNVAGTGAYDAGGDPVVAFSPDGTMAYFVCQSFNFTPPYRIQLLLNRGTVTTTGITWQTTGLTPISTWNGNGKTKGGNGQFPDHESIHVAASGRIYVSWAQFNGLGTHSPVLVATSSDGGRSFSAPVKVTVGNIRNNQDQRIVTGPNGDAYLTFDNGLQGGKGTVFYVSKSTDGGTTWSTPSQFATLVNPVCIFPTYCFNISGGQFRAGGTYPAPAFDVLRNRLVVAYADIAGPFGQMYVTSASANDLTSWTTPLAIAPASADQFMGELGIAPNGRYDVSFYDREYTVNQLVDFTYATSGDGGATWSHAVVSSSAFDPSTWGVPSSSALGYRPFIGDYNGIVSRNDWAGMTWTGVAAPQPYNLEIYFAKVT